MLIKDFRVLTNVLKLEVLNLCINNFAFFLLLAMCLCLLSVLMCYICNIRNVKFKYTVLSTGIGEFNKLVSKADKVVSKNIVFVNSLLKAFYLTSFFQNMLKKA